MNLAPSQLAKILELLSPEAALPSASVNELCSEYLAHKATRSRPHGFRSTQSRLRAVMALLGAQPASQLTHQAIDEYVVTRKKFVSQCTAGQEVQSLITVLRWGCKRRILIENPIANYEVVLNKGRRDRVFTRAEVASVLDAATRMGLRELFAVVITMAGSGIRPRELLQTRIEDVDLPRRLITVRADVAKTGKARKVALLPDGAAALSALVGDRKDGKVFRLAYTTLSGQWVKAVGFAGIAPNKNGSRAQLYSLRHTLATRCATELHFQPFELAAAMGWANVAQAQTYVQIQESALLASADKLQAANTAERIPTKGRPRAAT